MFLVVFSSELYILVWILVHFLLLYYRFLHLFSAIFIYGLYIFGLQNLHV